MKKIIYFTMMVMLSVMVLGSSAAEEKVKSDNRVASINEEGVKPNTQSAVEEKNIKKRFPAIEKMREVTDENLLVETEDYGCGPNKARPDTCDWLYSICCQSSPYYDNRICNYYTPGVCGTCYKAC